MAPLRRGSSRTTRGSRMRVRRRLSGWAGLGSGGRGDGTGGGRRERAGDVWDAVAGTPPTVRREVNAGPLPGVHARPGGAARRPGGGAEGGRAAPRARSSDGALACPRRTAASQRFEVYESLDHGGRARGQAPGDQDLRGPRHRRPDGDDPSPTSSPLGFHASVRSPEGALVRRPVLQARRQRLRQLLHARPRRRRGASSSATRSARARAAGSTRPTPLLGPEIQLRTYRLALITDPSYATYHGGAPT